MNKPFIATTALEEFWDTSYPMVFVGEWCKRYSRRSSWEPLQAETLASGLSEEDIFGIIRYLDQVYEKLLPLLAKVLNDIHGVDFSTRYWRIVLGPWLLHFLHAAHDKYHQIMRLQKEYPEFTTLCLDESCFVIPNDTWTFIDYMKSDSYNLELYSQLFDLLSYKFPKKKMTVQPSLDYGKILQPESLVKKIIYKSFNLIDRLFPGRNRVLFRDAYFPKFALARLIIETKGRFWPYVGEREVFDSLPINYVIRNKIGMVKFGDTEFERLLLPFASRGMPQSMLEGFATHRASVKQKNIQCPQAIMSAVSWHADDRFKVFAAESVEKGTVLLGVQHGGNYGSLKYLLQEEYELSITNEFFSWGWTKNDCYANVKPLSSPKLIIKKKRNSDRNTHDILCVTTSWPRFTFQYPWTVDLWKDYLNLQLIFLSNLSQAVKECLVIRPHREDCGLDFKERFRNIIPQVKIETWDFPFSERNYRLLICDHPCYSTTLMESLASNRPTILFGNPFFAANHLNDAAKPYWNRLKDVGILFDNPLDASKTINEIADHVEDWWNQPKRQEAVKLFLSRFGKTSKEWASEWCVEILKFSE